MVRTSRYHVQYRVSSQVTTPDSSTGLTRWTAIPPATQLRNTPMKPPADTRPRALTPTQNLPGTATAPGYASTFPGRADQLSQVRREIAAYLDDCPAADDIVLIADE